MRVDASNSGHNSRLCNPMKQSQIHLAQIRQEHLEMVTALCTQNEMFDIFKVLYNGRI